MDKAVIRTGVDRGQTRERADVLYRRAVMREANRVRQTAPVATSLETMASDIVADVECLQCGRVEDVQKHLMGYAAWLLHAAMALR